MDFIAKENGGAPLGVISPPKYLLQGQDLLWVLRPRLTEDFFGYCFLQCQLHDFGKIRGVSRRQLLCGGKQRGEYLEKKNGEHPLRIASACLADELW